MTTFTGEDDKDIQWEQVPVRLRRCQTTRYFLPARPGCIHGLIIGEDDTSMAEETFKISRQVLASYDATASYFSHLLSSYGVSPGDERDITRQVTELARSMSLFTFRPISIFVNEINAVDASGRPDLWEEVGALAEEEDDEGIDDNGMLAGDLQAIPNLPAPRSAIDRLEIVEVEGSGNCSICLEELPMGLQVTRMPCSHVFHSDCIVEWLKRSGLCPLCRFRMPCNA